MMNWLSDGSRQLPKLTKLSNSILQKLGQGKIVSERKQKAVVFLLPPKQRDPLHSLSRTFS